MKSLKNKIILNIKENHFLVNILIFIDILLLPLFIIKSFFPTVIPTYILESQYFVIFYYFISASNSTFIVYWIVELFKECKKLK